MRKLKLKYLHDADDMNPTHLETDQAIKIGDAVELSDGFWYGVTDIRILKRDIQLTLSKSSLTSEEAKLVMKQLSSD
ncbi:hypothetical protein [Pseudomonas putida]|uniref:hypothetical protein n=1 Tax=Pseudomonas putida TaxID=303 RepID=UPI0008195629|nr:hypothetical protein [Pseudomonas putida]OCT28181.1 hypothetical protein A6E20_26700 [Pseudomonas putida]OCT30218.1 hypothetical protein A6E24_26685 [Pseudomonas putida]OCT31074.1 hypothetical protein A6E23_00620 [Pseudomonas putida]OCT41074.1 hypothetical protein A6E19_25985 [Pseudomonas putida]